jgi:hypothetical protein
VSSFFLGTAARFALGGGGFTPGMKSDRSACFILPFVTPLGLLSVLFLLLVVLLQTASDTCCLPQQHPTICSFKVTVTRIDTLYFCLLVTSAMSVMFVMGVMSGIVMGVMRVVCRRG